MSHASRRSFGVVQGWLRAPSAGAAEPDAEQRVVHKTTLSPLSLLHGGEPLPDTIRVALEAYFQSDLRGVRIHVGAEAPTLGALAFTLGEHIYFAPGLFAPHSRRGFCLLGHEVAHVLQQRAGRVANPFPGQITLVQDPALEREADHLGVGVLRWLLDGCSGAALPRPASPATSAGPSWVVQRANEQKLFNELKAVIVAVKAEPVLPNARAPLKAAAEAVSKQASLQGVRADEHRGDEGREQRHQAEGGRDERRLPEGARGLPDRRSVERHQAVQEERHRDQAPGGRASHRPGGEEDQGPRQALAGAQPGYVARELDGAKRATDDQEKAIKALPGKSLIPIITKADVGHATTGQVSHDKAALRELTRAAGLKDAKGNFDSVFTAGVQGREGPTPDRNHIHIGGEANENLLFCPSKRVILGAVDFHMAKGLDQAKRKKIVAVEDRGTAGADTFLAFVNNGKLFEVM